MASVNQTRPHCVNQMGKTHSKPLAARTARHSRGTAWARHAMCESAWETAVLCCGLEKNGMVGAWHGKYESDTAAMCKSNGKDTFQILGGTAWQGKGMGTAWYVWIGLYWHFTAWFQYFSGRPKFPCLKRGLYILLLFSSVFCNTILATAVPTSW